MQRLLDQIVMPRPAVNRRASPGARPPLARMMRIHEAVQSGTFPNARQLAAEIEVSAKSIYRDIAFMQDQLGLPLEFDPLRNGYHYTEAVSAFPTLQITEGELFALLVAEKALQQYRGTSFEKPLMSAFRKMADSLPETISLNLAEWDASISFRTSATPVVKLEVFDQLAQATAARRQIAIVYRKPGRAAGEERTIDPYHLANINGEWFLFAYDHLRRDIRTFSPLRILSVRPTGKTFVRSRAFSLQQRLRGSFGVRSGEGEHAIRVRFDAEVAGYIREKIWHPSQRLAELPGGDVELQLKLSSLVEIERWILSWGKSATVLGPRELIESVQRAAAGILENHRG